MYNVAFNMETADPDDVFTLCILAGHPQVNLVGVVVTPGAYSQIALVKHVLDRLGFDIPVGARKPEHPKECVSAFHYKWLGNKMKTPTCDGSGAEVLNMLYNKHSDLRILSGAPLVNVYDFLSTHTANLEEIVVQGGFAGDNIVPPEFRLDKFEGKETCPTFNLGGDKQAALYITEDKYNQLKTQYYVSKNVCHGVVYGQKMHEKVRPHKNKRAGLEMLYEGMSVYLRDKPNGKLFHDPLAACALIDKRVCLWAPVKLFYQKGEWGCNKQENSNVKISIWANMSIFEEVLLQ